MKVIFLDIDGVLQPWNSTQRFKHIKEMDRVNKELSDKYGIDYTQYHEYDVAAVYFDWDKESVSELRRILEVTGAKIVISSDWRAYSTLERLVDFFRIHDMAEYVIDFNPIEDIYEIKYKNAEYLDFVHFRSIEILRYLNNHPEITKWVAIDDLHLNRDLGDENVVVTYSKMKKEDADKCIEILNK
jgi:hypothetical protein